jgi:hypothetical protein
LAKEPLKQEAFLFRARSGLASVLPLWKLVVIHVYAILLFRSPRLPSPYALYDDYIMDEAIRIIDFVFEK